MKYLLSSILLIYFLFSCSNQSELQNTWVLKSNLNINNTTNETSNIESQKHIMTFEGDNSTLSTFNPTDSTPTQNSYQVIGDQLVIQDRNINDTFNFELINNLLVLSKDEANFNQITFQVLPQYNLASQKQKLTNLLLSNSYLQPLNDSTFLEFEFHKNNNYFIISDLNIASVSSPYWYITNYENELFLCLNGVLFADIFHVKAIDPDFITLVAHDRDSREFFLKRNRSASQKKMITAKMIGSWENIPEEYIPCETCPPPPPPPPPPPKGLTIYENETLVISDSIMTIYEDIHKKKIPWQSSHSGNKIIFPNHPNKRHWYIKELSASNLVIERESYNRYEGYETELVTFTKIKE